jgi:hygromycin-B 4-O-kinase
MALAVAREFFGRRPVLDVESVADGHVARTFSFKVGGRDYIVQFNSTMLVNFEKKAYVYENFASPHVPIPRVVHLGRLGEVHFAISEKAPGRNLLQLPRADYLALVPAQIETLDAIHQTPVGERPGYGIFDGRGVGLWPSWREHLLAISEEEEQGDFYEKWHSLFRDSFLERDLFERIYERMVQLSGYCPEDRCLVHGGYGFGNVLAEDGRITAVLDWMDARYGDFLYDVAWLDFWSPDDGWQGLFQEHYARMGREVPFYRERVSCYHCYISLDALRFNAKARDKTSYDWVRERILSLLRGDRHESSWNVETTRQADKERIVRPLPGL